jgi:basic membrane protein A and related proteins
LSVRKWMPWLAVALVAILALAVTSVGSAKPAASKAPAAASKAGGDAIKVALVTDIGGLDDKSFNFLANVGLSRAKRQLGAQGRVYISKSNADYVPNLVAAARTYRADLVIGVGFLMADAVAAAAKRYPNTKFAIVDYPAALLKGKPKNARGLLFAEQEAGYLAGVAAATVSKTGVIGSVGGQKIPPVDAFIAGYRYGAKKTKASIRTLNGYSQDFVAQDKCKEQALNMVDQDADVLFQVAGQCGLGVLSAARERNVWGIGVDADQGYIGPHVLTSAQKKVDVAVFSTAQLVQQNKFKGGVDQLFNVKNNGVGYGKLSSRAPRGLKAKLDLAVRGIKSGAIKGIPRKV